LQIAKDYLTNKIKNVEEGVWAKRFIARSHSFEDQQFLKIGRFYFSALRFLIEAVICRTTGTYSWGILRRWKDIT